MPIRLGGATRPRLFLPWLAFAAACLVWMCLAPGEEVVPFHLIWIAFALAYGFEAWAPTPTVVSLSAITVTTGVVLLARAGSGAIAWEETAEIPLMLLLAALVVWHVQRREAALRTVTLLADREAAAAARRVRLARLTSHEMRTPLTIASGYVELILARGIADDVREELEVVHDELGRLERASDRLLRMIQLAEPLQRSPVDLDALLEETARRWSAVAERDWRVESRAGSFRASAERVRACLDTLIENAVRHTGPGDTVLLHSARTDGEVWLGVADSGPGMDAELAAAINAREQHATHLVRSEETGRRTSQTGLGIALVQEIMESRGGRVVVGRSHLGGALVVLILETEEAAGGSLVELAKPSNHPPAIRHTTDAALWSELSPDTPPSVAHGAALDRRVSEA